MLKNLVLIVLFFVTTSVAQANISISPSYVNFGNVEVNGWQKMQTVRIYNFDDENVSLSFMDTCTLDFDFQHYFCSTLMAHQSCSLSLYFSPNSPGYKTCTIYVSGSGAGFQSIHVSGYGVDSDQPF